MGQIIRIRRGDEAAEWRYVGGDGTRYLIWFYREKAGYWYKVMRWSELLERAEEVEAGANKGEWCDIDFMLKVLISELEVDDDDLCNQW